LGFAISYINHYYLVTIFQCYVLIRKSNFLAKNFFAELGYIGFRLRDDSNEAKPTVTPRRIEYHYNY